MMTDTPMRRIAVVGMFDGLHLGHRYLLGQLRLHAAELSLKPLVITFTSHPLETIAPEKAPPLMTSPLEKAAMIKEAGFLGDEVLLLPFNEKLRSTTAEGFLAMLRDRLGVAALLMGFNNRFGCDAPDSFDAYRRLADKEGVMLIRAKEMPGTAGVSSSAIRRLVASGDVAGAARLLGRRYSVSGTIVKGKALGRTIGFPTANLRPATGLLPAPGVYAAAATVKPPLFSDSGREMSYPAMVNIGSRPTVDAPGAPLSVEAHLIGLPPGSDIYGCRMSLDFAGRIRTERRFDSVESLAAQLAGDRDSALALLAD